MNYRLTDKCPLTVILQLVGDQTYDLSAYGSKEEAWDAEKGEYWVEGAENIDEARSEFMATLYEYSQELVLSAALDEQAWPFDWGYVTEIYECEVCLKFHSNEFSLTCETCDFKRESEGLTLEGEDA